jgi:hypothetical protein
MTPATRALLLSLATAFAGVTALDLAYGRYAGRHFGPNATLAEAEAVGDGCVVALGDSRMAAGFDPASVASALQRAGSPRCVAQLSIGGTPISTSAMAIRRYVADGRRPAMVVVGESPGSLLPFPKTIDPSDLFGNRAAEIAWSRASDVELFYPGFPFTDLDRGVRFSLARTNALVTYESGAWLKVKTLQERLVAGPPTAPRNRFGTIADMNALLDDFRSAALVSLAEYDGRWEHSRWFDLLRAVVRASGARLVVVELPMISRYRAEVLESPAAQRYRAWLRDDLAKDGVPVIDLSHPSTIHDEDFGDGLHLDEGGARRFSTELGDRIAALTGAPKE